MLSRKFFRFRTDSILLPYNEIPELFVKIGTQVKLEHLLQILLSILYISLIHELNAFRFGLVEFMRQEKGSMRTVYCLHGVLGAVHLKHGLVGLLKE